MRWRVTFLLDDIADDGGELRDFEVDADSEQDAIAAAEAAHPWEAEESCATTAVPVRAR